MRVIVLHTSQVDATLLSEARALLYAVFDDMTEHDWEHCLGGMHALAVEGVTLVGHGSVVQRRLFHDGVALRTGYVEGVAVHADFRRRGCGAAIMGALEPIITRTYDLGALGATDEAARFYASRGWKLWRGPSSVMSKTGIVRTPNEDGCIWVFGSTLDVTGELTCDWRDGDVW